MIPPLTPRVSLCGRQDEFRIILMGMGAIDVITTSMATHRYDPDMQLYACWALVELASGDEGVHDTSLSFSLTLSPSLSLSLSLPLSPSIYLSAYGTH
jgi:hypothetical protein